MKRAILSACVAAVTFGIAGVAESALIVNESFDYAIDTVNPDPDGGANGGNGFPASNAANPSQTGIGLRSSWGAGTKVVGGLSYADLVTSDNALIHSATGWVDGAVIYRFVTPDPFISYRADTDGAASNNNGGNLGADGNTLYFSYLVNFADVTKTNRFTLSGNDGVENFFLGLNGTNGNFSFSGPVTTTTSGSVPVSNGETNLVVGRINFATPDSLSVWVNPDLASFDGTETADITATNTGAFSFWQAKFNGDTANNMTLDELRIGTDLSDVTPVNAIPEPAALSVLALGATSMLRRRQLL